MSIVLIFVLVTLAVYLVKTKLKLVLIGHRIPGPFAIPLLGNAQMIPKLKPQYLFAAMTSYRDKYRQTYRMWLGLNLWVFLHSPEETREALNDSTLARPDTFQKLNVLIGDGLLLSKGKQWETHRRALGPAFHPNVLNKFTPTIAEHANILVEKIVENLKQSIEASEYMFPCILDAIMATSMGVNLKAQQDPYNTYTHAIHNANELLFKRMSNPLLAPDFIFRRTKMFQKLKASIAVIHELMKSIIEKRISVLEENKNGQLSNEEELQTLLNTLLTIKINGHPLSFQEIHDEVNTFVFAGVDTTTAALSFVLYSLGKYPAEQEKIYAEIQNVFQSKTCELTVSQLSSLNYLDMFIKECLRYYTVVPMTGRQTTKNIKIGNIEYCEGVTLWINMYGLAHDEEFFEDPNEFKPLRFADKTIIKPFSFLPFSGGPHVCIGKKYAILIMKILIVRLLQNFEIFLNDPNEKIILMAQMVLKSLNGINLRFKIRE